jgi:ribosome-associated protein
MTDGLRINRTVTIPWNEIELRFSPSGGPGGQHANRSSTRVDLAWNVATSKALGPRQRARIRAALRNRIDSSGIVRLSSDTHRSQLRNREDVVRRLASLVAGALQPVRRRVATSPSAGAVERRLKEKRRRSDIKRSRRLPHDDA